MQIGTEQDTAKWKPTAAWNEATEEARRPHAKTAQWPANAPRNAQERMQRQSMSCSRTELAASQVRVREVESKFAESFVVIESEAKEIANERVPSGLTG